MFYQKYHDYTKLPVMVLPDFALQGAENTMKNTINDADYIINLEYLFLLNQYIINFRHSHSIVPGGLPVMS